MPFESNPTGVRLTNRFGIYVHTPFCRHRCSYCDFFSIADESADFDPIVRRQMGELQEAAAWLKQQRHSVYPVTSVFLGGGTPSLMPVQHLSALLGELQRQFPLEPGAELTLEANPETVSEELCLRWKNETSINRVSLGAQSFEPDLLERLERRGSRESIVQATGFLKRADFSNFSLDLIFAIPGQGLKRVLSDLARAVDLGPQHVSFYQLTLKPGHRLYAELPGEEEAAEMYEAGVEFLSRAGYVQYEISNFAKPGYESRHNLLYWSGDDFLGIGPSAASRFFWGNRFSHRRQLADLRGYLMTPPFPAPGFEKTTLQQTWLEAVFLELRRNSGVALDPFRDRYGYDLRTASQYSLFCSEGLIREEQGRLFLTSRGRLLADSVASGLVDV